MVAIIKPIKLKLIPRLALRGIPAAFGDFYGVKTMTQSSSPKTVRRGRVFPEKQLSPEEKARIKAEDAVFYQRCRKVFERVQPELIAKHYDWFIIIEPNSGEYVIDEDEKVAIASSRSRNPGKKCMIMRINETGTCGTI